ncbi:glycoside hydrolase family 43 protein [Novipirellula artificiosorum]|uniref:Beta-xylosidase n=1 Tax=Novipirellula artificiosorum TaxID=2528016 RepID=A0A5C6DTP6_9BACT|nr:glycoside hydrolase 43 family protein [Novipirellula artificiosorum]TWU39257.1 Beta-xylosidase [Novipirellula artificiosorum]
MKLASLPGLVLLVLLSSPATAQQTGSWGDQGDGTYRNPILNADYPDVDVEQVGDTYYMISSKQHMSPGMVILESKDMVNWTSIGHVWKRLDWAPEYDWDQMNGYSFGVWAGDLAYHDGTWYCYQIDFKHGLYMSSAADIHGPWSTPVQMLPTEKVFDDPAVFWDDTAHQAYLLCNTGTKQRTERDGKGGNENRLYKMSWDGQRIEDEGTVIYRGTGAEAAKIYKVDGRWYFLIAQWFQKKGELRDRKQVVLRSKTDSIYGPYENKIVLERGNGFARSCSQGALMQAADKSWWYTHQLIQNIDSPFQGRPQCLEPVTWIDGWPIIGQDVDGDGIGEPVRQHQKPIKGFAINAPMTDDDFSQSRLGPSWEWNHNPRDSHWSLTERPGWLRLKACVPIPKDQYAGSKDQVFWRACNTVSQRIMGTTVGSAVAKFDLSSMAPGQQAGFVRFGGQFHLLGVEVEDSMKKHLFFMNHDGTKLIGPEITTQILFLRTRNLADQARFEYSTDGETFQSFGPEFTLVFGSWTGDRLGLFCWNENEEAGCVDIDSFRYDYDGPKATR